MPTRREILSAALLAAAAGALPGRKAAAQDQVTFFRIGTGTTGGTYFPIGGILAGAISGPPGLPPCGSPGGGCGVPGLIAVAQASAGSVDNIRQIAAGTLEAGLAQSDVAFAAYTGDGPFAADGPIDVLRAIAHLYDEVVHVIVEADGPIRGIRDLFGKRVGIGPAQSGTQFDVRVILDAYGLSFADIERVESAPEAAGDMMVRGEIDAFLMIGGPPVAFIADLAKTTPLRFLPIEGPEAETLVKESPFFTMREMPAEAYPGVEPVATLAVGALFVVASSIPDDTAYEITRALWEPTSLELLHNGHPRAAEISLDTALLGLAIPLHPGAARWYAERAAQAPAEEQAPSAEDDQTSE
jgi:TRAP transporter TAXI family solute receptor